jgi:hypothetical protein
MRATLILLAILAAASAAEANAKQPQAMQVTISGIGSNGCDCSPLNSTFVLPLRRLFGAPPQDPNVGVWVYDIPQVAGNPCEFQQVVAGIYRYAGSYWLDVSVVHNIPFGGGAGLGFRANLGATVDTSSLSGVAVPLLSQTKEFGKKCNGSGASVTVTAQ